MLASVVGGGCEVGESSLGGGGGIEERFINQDGSDMCREVAHILIPERVLFVKGRLGGSSA